MRSVTLLLAAALICSSVDVWAQSRSLCPRQEKVLFSCSIEGKILSLCGSADLSDSSGYLKYQFGVGYADRQNLELVYPRANMRPRDAFAGLIDEHASYLQFSVGSYVYTVYQEVQADPSIALFGVAVRKPSGDLIYMECDPSSDIKGSLAWMDKLALPFIDLKKRVYNLPPH
jgi:hypothetical protein